MDIFEAIKTRRSIGKVKQDVIPPKEHIEQILDSARWAPNHFKTEPWRFTVLTGNGRKKLGDVYGKINISNLPENATEEDKTKAYEKGVSKALRAPVVIIIHVEPSSKEKVKDIEEIEATACAVQNMLLTTHALGLGAVWRSGDPAYTNIMNQAFDVEEPGQVLGYLYLGYPLDDMKKSQPDRKSIDEIARWITE
ncbi:nitroreductase [Terrilactibacillus sp. BCM23-1]|uniref:Putative NAD(P)H nitroreductase n=1 Tax=Terrilactibacillus tamarindi TaxID=2599694 RepID=A0A6N8CSJ4_9BACI|nr:nitroreductase [Terrilactibacillus tamarindi]MTT33169.1 nitroreductase [Terrilactibacillus tamarindi]